MKPEWLSSSGIPSARSRAGLGLSGIGPRQRRGQRASKSGNIFVLLIRVGEQAESKTTMQNASFFFIPARVFGELKSGFGFRGIAIRFFFNDLAFHIHGQHDVFILHLPDGVIG